MRSNHLDHASTEAFIEASERVKRRAGNRRKRQAADPLTKAIKEAVFARVAEKERSVHLLQVLSELRTAGLSENDAKRALRQLHSERRIAFDRCDDDVFVSAVRSKPDAA